MDIGDFVFAENLLRQERMAQLAIIGTARGRSGLGGGAAAACSAASGCFLHV
jgi:hypothetical protein